MATVTAPRRAAAPQIRQTQLFIDGQWVPAKSGKTFETINPATDCLLYTSPSPRDRG